MKNTKFILAVLSLVLLSFLAVANLAGSPAVSAAPLAGACYSLYLPAIVNSGESGTQEMVASRSPDVACSSNSNSFPDFNGDGYADLAIGVPNKEVFDGIINQVDAGIVQVVYGSADGLNAVVGEAAVEDQIWHRALGGTAALADDHYGWALAMGDFNSDGYDDLAVGIPGAVINGQNNAGAVQVVYGSAAGLALANIQEWSRGNTGIQGTAAVDDAFGRVLTAGDYDGDGFTDLAIGVPYADVNGDSNAGAVHILYGRNSGLSALANELLTQDTPGFVPSPAEADDRFGFALATGDFNGDGVDDLATGSPWEDNGDDFANAGAVQIFFGQSGAAGDWGIIRFGSVANPQHWTADTNAYVEGAMEPDDRFGYSLAAGDFNGDGYDDLAVGIPLETHGTGAGALFGGGAINVFQGGATGLIATAAYPARLWHQDSTGMDDEVAAEEYFGFSLTAADFDNNGYDDLAIGVFGNRTYGIAIGAAHIMYGTSIGVTASNDELIYDPVNPEAHDYFGWATAAGDFNGDGFTDLVVGAFADDPIGVAADNSGSVFTFYSDSNGASQTEYQNWYPGYNGMRGTPADDDYFGSALPGSPNASY